jgi:predicted transposase/invertase (TIGR01784 family)
MATERLNPLNDFLFLKMMGEKGDEVQLLGFLNAVLGQSGKSKLKSVEILEDRVITPEILGDKTSILDVRAQAEDGTKVNIEVQLRNLGDMDRRSLFYWSKEYSRQIKAGEHYIELPDVIAINIVNFDCIPSKSFHACFHLWEDTEKDLMLTDAMEIHFIDMVKFRHLRDNIIKGDRNFLNDPLHRWLTFFDKNSPAELIEEVIKMDMAIQKAQERTVFITQDEVSMTEYIRREMALSDWNSAINYHTREAKKETALKMKADNMTMEQIIKYTGLTESQINDL